MMRGATSMPYADPERQKQAQRESVNRRRAARRTMAATVTGSVAPPVEPARLRPPTHGETESSAAVEPPVEPDDARATAPSPRDPATARTAASPPPSPTVEPF